MGKGNHMITKRKGTKAAVTALSLGAMVLGVTSSALAHERIGYTWNSDDHDVKAKFIPKGDNFYAKEYHGTTYVDYSYADQYGLTWWVQGSHDGKRHMRNESMPEGKSVAMNVCQHHNAWPSDCSGWKYGVS